MKKISIFYFLLFFGIMFSQTHRFVYELQMKKKNNAVQKINMVLDIDKEYVHFYDYDFLRNDSLRKKEGGSNWQTNTRSEQLILRKINSFENKSFHDNMFDYFVIDSKDNMNWKIEKDTKKSGDYTLQKAVTNFGGRDWTAWFCPNVPFQEGPYKFRGLPGLIFEVQDSKGDYSYSLVKSTNLPSTFDTSDFLETHFGHKPVPITLKQYFKIKLDYYNDPVADMRRMLKDGGTIIIGGDKITSQEQLDQKRIFIQNSIKSNYNPIEQDKAIPYPVK
ncbi:GLPGLI family protein [Elizabethkingia meningoseptica]|uniref:GLPGLI family protein n=1 Tax=Elizabethkingia meningoseptica TaxID=238 RepID=UPI0003A907D7|nr:GLPGLI family protein [Elizabethkingia meningoseptica]AQX06891.1 GLPGLI family protein [Elizabethkingia meningoseptica]OPB69606.1 GLPGLI family protein [Elizabethkingia meningoseptica]